MDQYKIINNQIFKIVDYSIVTIRNESSRYNILKLSNKQIYHLRQSTPSSQKKINIFFLINWFQRIQ